jgi:hypothetical protein
MKLAVSKKTSLNSWFSGQLQGGGDRNNTDFECSENAGAPCPDKRIVKNLSFKPTNMSTSEPFEPQLLKKIGGPNWKNWHFHPGCRRKHCPHSNDIQERR